MICRECGRNTLYLIEGVCRRCSEDVPKTIEQWMRQLNWQLDEILARISDINSKLKEVK